MFSIFANPVLDAEIVTAFVAFLVICKLISSSFVYINNGSYGVVEKLWSFSARKRSNFMALHGEPGFQPDIIHGGVHFLFPFMYRVHKQRMITVKGIAYLFARDGAPMKEGQALAQFPESTTEISVGDARAFLQYGGQQGPQRQILREGLYAINTALFAVFTEEGIFTVNVGEDEILQKIDDASKAVNGYDPIILDSDGVGIVTVNDGPSLEHGEIIAPTVGTDRDRVEFFHNSFQSVEKFLKAGGRRGRQEQVLVEGRYYINRLFATVEIINKEVIPVGFVGVVNSYAGPQGADVSGTDHTHGELVEVKQKGIWNRPLLPGKYAINPYAMRVIKVPTTNFVLRWQGNSVEDHGFDKNLQEIKLITSDAYEPIVGLSLVLHIAANDAPYVIQQFADLQLLVDQTLDTIVSSWFRDAVQGLKMLQFISQRSELQGHAAVEIGAKLQRYRLSLQQIMLGTPHSDGKDGGKIQGLFTQLTERELAAEQKATFEARKLTAETERGYNEAKAIAENQQALTGSKIAIEVAQNKGAAALAEKTQAARATVVTAEADAQKTELLGAAEAKRIALTGEAEAAAAAAQVQAWGGTAFAMQKFLAEIARESITNSRFALVPQIQLGGTAGETGGMADVLAAAMLAGLRQPPAQMPQA
jgi:uncharacterized membrane protein YqiK